MKKTAFPMILVLAGLLVLLCACAKNPPQPTSAPTAAPATAAPATAAPAPTEAPATPEPTPEPTAEATPELTPEPTPAPTEAPAMSAEEKKAIAEGYIDRDVEELYAAIGEPEYSDYAPSCLGEGDDGNLYYDGFIVYTYRENGTETVTYVE